MKLTEKTKRYLAVGGGSMICIALIAAISLQFGRNPSGEDVLPEGSRPITEIIVNPSVIQTEESGEELETGDPARNGCSKRSRGNTGSCGQPTGPNGSDRTEHPAGCGQTGSAK